MNRVLLFGGIAAAVAAGFAIRPAPAPPAITQISQPSSTPRERKHLRQAVAGSIVYVVGAVARPGLYRLRPQARLDEAVRLAGGFTRDADPASVNLAEYASDGEEVQVLRAGQAPVKAARRKSLRGRRTKRRKASAPAVQIDLNTADADTLATLPGVGALLAQRIVDYRTVNGSFASVDELADVGGVTQRLVDELAAYVTVR